jgi:hypothetical protein
VIFVAIKTRPALPLQLSGIVFFGNPLPLITPVTVFSKLERFGIRVALQLGICCLLLIMLQ